MGPDASPHAITNEMAATPMSDSKPEMNRITAVGSPTQNVRQAVRMGCTVSHKLATGTQFRVGLLAGDRLRKADGAALAANQMPGLHCVLPAQNYKTPALTRALSHSWSHR